MVEVVQSNDSPHAGRAASILLNRAGAIRIETPFWSPEVMTHSRDETVVEWIELPYAGNGYQYEADEVGRCIAAGKTESDLMPLAESIRILETLDAIKAQWGERGA